MFYLGRNGGYIMGNPIYWTKSVELELDGPGRFRKIRSTRDAAECLSHWPVKGGAAHSLATSLCRAALEGGVPRKVAREAFIYAAQEGGIRIRVGPHQISRK